MSRTFAGLFLVFAGIGSPFHVLVVAVESPCTAELAAWLRVGAYDPTIRQVLISGFLVTLIVGGGMCTLYSTLAGGWRLWALSGSIACIILGMFTWFAGIVRADQLVGLVYVVIGVLAVTVVTLHKTSNP